MWCEHDAPVDCECIDGPHPWIKYIAAQQQPTQSDALLEGDTQTILYLLGVRHGREDERAKVAAEASQPTQSDALREALVDLLHAVCGKTGFVETVRRDSGRIYPWPALDLAEAKALEALERSK